MVRSNTLERPETGNRTGDGGRGFPARVLVAWSRRRRSVLWFASGVMALLGLASLMGQFHRLLLEQGAMGAVDLGHRYREIHAWFAGDTDVYAVLKGDYPPASHLMLWPLIGWLSFPAARWFWAVTSVIMLAWLIALVIRVTAAESLEDRVFLAILVLALNATGQTIGNGQLIIHILPFIVAGHLLLERAPFGRNTDFLVAGMLLWTLVQPTIGAPFFWVLLLGYGAWRPAVMVLAGYTCLTLVAAGFQPHPDVLATLSSWIQVVTEAAPTLAETEPGGPYANLNSWLHFAGLGSWAFPASLSVLGLLGIWVYRHRRIEQWILLSVSAITARLWTYHRQYDDMLMLIPILAIFMLARKEYLSTQARLGAGCLFAVSLLVLLTPYRVLHTWSTPWPELYEVSHTSTWLLMLGVLLTYARSLAAKRNRMPVYVTDP